MKYFDSFYPSPYKIEDLNTRGRYKVFLFLLKRYDFQKYFKEMFLKRFGEDKNPLDFFNDSEIAFSGYFNRLCSWRKSCYGGFLQDLELLNQFILFTLKLSSLGHLNDEKWFQEISHLNNFTPYGLTPYHQDGHINKNKLFCVFDIMKNIKKSKKENLIMKIDDLHELIKKIGYHQSYLY